MTEIGPSVIRTVVPWIVGILLTLAAQRGLDLPESVATEVVTAVVSAVYYALVRLAEVRLSPLWGWLLGLPKAPLYGSPDAYQARHAA